MDTNTRIKEVRPRFKYFVLQRAEIAGTLKGNETQSDYSADCAGDCDCDPEVPFGNHGCTFQGSPGRSAGGVDPCANIQPRSFSS